MKTFLKVTSIIFICLCLIVFLRNSIILNLLSIGLEKTTGLKLIARHFDIGITSAYINIKDLLLLNPKGFPDPVMMYLPYLYVQYDPLSIIKGKLHFDLVRIYLSEFNVVKAKDGDLNIDSIKIIKCGVDPDLPQKKKNSILINVFELKIGEVCLKDYSKNPYGDVRIYKVGVDEKYSNIADFETLAKIIVVKSLAKTTIANIANFNLAGLKKDISAALGSGVKLIDRTVNGTLGKTFEIITQPFQAQEPQGN